MFGSRKSLLAIDLGASSVKILEVHRDRDDLVLTNFSRVDIQSDANRAEAIAECLRRGKFKTKHAVAAISGKSVIVRFLTMPRMSHEELNRAVKFEAEKYIPWPVDESQIDAVSLGDLPGQDQNAQPEMRVLLVAAKKTFVNDFSQMLIQNGLVPLAIDIDSIALATAYEMHERASNTSPAPGAIALVDIGAGKTSVNIISGGTPRFIREIDNGGGDMTQCVAQKFGMETQEAERVKCSPGDRSSEIEEIVMSAVADLANELNLSFDYFEHQGDGSVDSIHLSGGASSIVSIAENIERATGKRTHLWNPIDGLKVHGAGIDLDDLNAHAPSLAVAVGLAAREY
ncbi:MAG: type IV pilus assembly protein PilM [Planctomycetes bacterium]|nr:type IV pilus assembly protein PilM [Planctomycetota bacterium]